QDSPGMLLVLCMAGFLAAVTQAPITSFIIVMEMVDGYSVVIGLMAVSLLSSGVSRIFSPPLYQTVARYMLARHAGLPENKPAASRD
ncbi:MAG: chloride channel protein, partial [Methyloversatilis sp.]|nr:chloride channel protein [Methyloversatilis sp.]